MRKIKLNKPKSYIDAGNQLLELINLNNIQTSNFNNFIRNVIPNYMNRVIDRDYFTISFSNWYLDNSSIPSSRRCIAHKLTREISLRAMVNISIKRYKIGNENVLNNITYTIPVELTRIPILSDQGSFIIKGVDRVMVSHLEDATGINITDDKGLHTRISTVLRKSVNIFRDESSGKYQISVPRFGTYRQKTKGKYDSNSITFSIYDFMKEMGVDNIHYFREIVGNNVNMLNGYKSQYIDEDAEELLKNISLRLPERERINRRLSFKWRLSGKTIAEDISVGELNLKSGDVISEEDAEYLQNMGITRVNIQTEIGPFPIVNNGFKDPSFVFNGNIPSIFNHYDAESKELGKIDGYYKVSDEEMKLTLKEVEEEEIDLNTHLKVNFNNITGSYLLKQDIISLLNLYSAVEMGFEPLDDRDSLANKSIINISTIFETLLAEQVFGISSNQSKSLVSKVIANLDQYRLSHSNSNSELKFNNLNCDEDLTITSKLLRDPLNKLFTRESNVNPMDEISHKRKITLVKVEGRGGISADRSMAVPRSVNPSHMGRICPIETPEGKSIGLVLNLASLARVNEYDMIEAPFFKMDKEAGKIKYDEVYYMTYDEEKKYSRAIAPQIASRDECYVSLTKKGIEVDKIDLQPLYQMVGQKTVLSNRESLEAQAKELFQNNNSGADAYKLVINRKDWFEKEPVDCVVGDGDLVRLNWDEIDLVTCRGEHIFSASGSALPFSEYDDGVRLMMGINMSKQTEPTMGSTEPLIKTPVSDVLGKESMGVIRTTTDGVITEVNSKYIKMVPISDKDDEPQKEMVIALEQCKVSSDFTKISNIPNVSVGDMVFKGDVLADSESSHNGQLAIGNNLTVAYMSWEGYNYEDAIVISDRLLKENILTSFRVDEYEFDINTDVDSRVSSTEVLDKKEHQKFRKICNSDGIIKVGTKVRTKDILALKYTKSRGKDAYKIKILEYTGIDEGIVTRVIPQEINKNITNYIIQVTTKEKIKVGDKLAGRHGNKGVIGKILESWKMPYLDDGTRIDIMLTPLGIPSRMNIGQLIESQLGLILQEAGLQIVSYPGVDLNIPRVKALLNNYTGDELGKLQLYDGRTGDKFLQKTHVGVTTINKLKHLATHKIAARSYGNFNQYDSDGQPTKGRKNFGGQRLGEMELWALEAHGAQACAQELLTYKSDDETNREMFKRRIKKDTGEPLTFDTNISSPYRRVVSYMTALGIDMIHYNSNGNEVDVYADKNIKNKRKFSDNFQNSETISAEDLEGKKRLAEHKDRPDASNNILNLIDADDVSTDDFFSDIMGLDLGGDISEDTVEIPVEDETYGDVDIDDYVESLESVSDVDNIVKQGEKFTMLENEALRAVEKSGFDEEDDDYIENEEDTEKEEQTYNNLVIEESDDEESDESDDVEEGSSIIDLSDTQIFDDDLEYEESVDEEKDLLSNINSIDSLDDIKNLNEELGSEVIDDLIDDIEELSEDDENEEKENEQVDLSILKDTSDWTMGMDDTFKQKDYSNYDMDDDEYYEDKYSDYIDDDYSSFERIKRKPRYQ